MKILTFDTSLDKMYIALSEDKEVQFSTIVENSKEKYHSAYLIPTIAALLKEKSLTMQNIGAIGVNIGPGSFTGIRAGLTVARVMGQALDIPVVGVSSLEIISTINNTSKDTLCVLDARKEMAYTAIYNSNTEVMLEPQALLLDEVFEKAQNDYCIVADSKMEKLLAQKNIASVNFQSTNHDFGKSLAKLTFEHLQKAKESEYNWYNCKPLYIQPPPISMPKKVVV